MDLWLLKLPQTSALSDPLSTQTTFSEAALPQRPRLWLQLKASFKDVLGIELTSAEEHLAARHSPFLEGGAVPAGRDSLSSFETAGRFFFFPFLPPPLSTGGPVLTRLFCFHLLLLLLF